MEHLEELEELAELLDQILSQVAAEAVGLVEAMAAILLFKLLCQVHSREPVVELLVLHLRVSRPMAKVVALMVLS
jgi:hypothetical protein